jgi:hypothetical protein
LILSCPGNRSDQRGIHADFALSYAPPRLVHPENFKAEIIVWLRKARGTPAEWQRRAVEEQRAIENTVAQVKAAGWGDTLRAYWLSSSSIPTTIP